MRIDPIDTVDAIDAIIATVQLNIERDYRESIEKALVQNLIVK